MYMYINDSNTRLTSAFVNGTWLLIEVVGVRLAQVEALCVRNGGAMERLSGMWSAEGEQSGRQAGLGASLRVPLQGQYRHRPLWVDNTHTYTKKSWISYVDPLKDQAEKIGCIIIQTRHYSCPLSERREFSSPIALWSFSEGDELSPKCGTKVWSEVSVLQSCAPGANGSYFLWAVHFTCSFLLNLPIPLRALNPAELDGFLKMMYLTLAWKWTHMKLDIKVSSGNT